MVDLEENKRSLLGMKNKIESLGESLWLARNEEKDW